MSEHNKKTSLVLLSGLLCDASVWSPVAEQLSDCVDSHIFSFAGYNSLSAMAEYVLSAAPDKFVLAGHSMGGRVALEVYRKAPNRVTHIALLNTGVHSLKDSEIPGRQRLLDLAKKEGMQAIVDTWLPPMMSPLGLQNTVLLTQLQAMILSHTQEDFSGQIHALLNRPNAEEVLSTIAVPTLLLSASEDAWSPMSQHRDMQKSMTNNQTVTLIELTGVGHMSIVEAPKRVATILRDWLPRF